jgi:hypothetical protein
MEPDCECRYFEVMFLSHFKTDEHGKTVVVCDKCGREVHNDGTIKPKVM